MKPFAQQTYYELLEVPVTAQMEEIHAAYSRLMELYAPDSIAVYALVDADQVDALRARMTEAMEILTDADLRVEYDKDLGLPARKVAEAVTAPVPVPEVGPTQRAAEALASAVEDSASPAPSPVATPEVAGKGTEEPEPELSGPAAFRASFVSGYSLSYVTSSLQTAPFGGGLVGMPAAGRMDVGAASPVGSDSSVTPASTPVDTRTESPAAAVSVAAPASVVAEAPGPAAPSSESPVAASSPASAESPVVAPVASSTPAPSTESPVVAPSPSGTASSSTADASAEAQGAQTPATEPEPEEPVVAQVPPAPSPVEDVPVPPVAAQPPVTEPEPPAPAPPSTSIVVSPPPLRSTGTSRPTTSPTGASAQTRGPGRQLGDAQVIAQDAAIATAEAAMAQVAARVRDVRPRLPDIPADAEFNGELLRRVRETRGFTLQQVADRTRISSRHLENVEADRYTLLPPPVYLRGILMNLARELGLDPLRVSRSYLGLASEKSGKK